MQKFLISNDKPHLSFCMVTYFIFTYKLSHIFQILKYCTNDIINEVQSL